MNLFKIIKYQLYLLQLENYELGRYFKLLFKKGLFPRGEQRKVLVWTAKAKVLFLMAVGLHILVVIIVGLWIPAFAGMTVRVGLLFLAFFLPFTIYCLLFTTALLFLWPVDFLVKAILIKRAKLKIKNLATNLDPGLSADKAGSESGMAHIITSPAYIASQSVAGRPNPSFEKRGITIIGIAGSYGKTTMKEMLKQVLGSRFQVLATPESVNTPVGIARWILKNLDSSVQILIVEMGEHYRGDVEEICKLVRPDISVVTGINEAHLERMGNLQNTTDTIFEVVSNLKPQGLAVLNADDVNVVENYKKYIWPDQRVVSYQLSAISSAKFNTERLGWDLGVEEVGKVFVNLLGEYALGNVDAIVKIAKELGMNNEDIKKGLDKIKPVSHRLEPIASTSGILVIDDAYNGNSKGVSEAIKVLSRFDGRRKVYITPGLVETGKVMAEVHRNIGKQLAGVADVVVLIKNSVTPYIEQGIKGSAIASAPEAIPSNREIATSSDAFGLAMTKVIWFSTAQEAHESLKNILQPGDVVVFQNDWGDQYV